MTGFLDAAQDLLQKDRVANELRLYFYAVTRAGWSELTVAASTWRAARGGRTITAYLGTDHALTEPSAIEAMRDAGVSVRLLRRYNGVYHPKVMWFVEGGAGHLLIGSNNLTLDGLKSNIEFATLTRLSTRDANLERWHKAVHTASDPLADDLLRNYRSEKEAFGKARAKAKVAGTFTWSKRSSGGAPQTAPISTPPRRRGRAADAELHALGAAVGDLIIEVMPRETGTGGSQMQIPMAAAREFFGLGREPNSQLSVSLRNIATGEQRDLTMTRFTSATARLVVHELDYRARPCMLVFHRRAVGTFDFDLIRESIDPDRYRGLLRHCPQQRPQRRWIVVATQRNGS